MSHYCAVTAPALPEYFVTPLAGARPGNCENPEKFVATVAGAPIGFLKFRTENLSRRLAARRLDFRSSGEFGIYLEILDGPLRRRGAVAVRHISSVHSMSVSQSVSQTGW